jgi:very-short-patch-repair endonuclease
MEASFAALQDGELQNVAVGFLQHFPPSASLRNTIQELLWEGTAPTIPKRFRREIATALGADDLYLDQPRFDALLTSLWVLDGDDFAGLLGPQNDSLRAAIDRHVYRNPGDLQPVDLFDRLGAYDCTDRRFCLFLEGLASADVRPNEPEQRRFAALVNNGLQRCGAELRETDAEGGYPVFRVVSTRAGPRGRPKNLIFASPEKPDLRFRDALNNDIEIVGNADKVLVYDQPIGEEGLRWRDLQAWWAEREGLNAGDAKASLYRRLRASLPSNSPPQRFFFETFYKTFGGRVQELPALLPEVWLHWDPKTVKERGPDALLRFRMDFLLLLPRGGRIVIEVDGAQHFADADGRASPVKYGATMAADRELRLVGYEVFRFGAAELDATDGASRRVKDFLEALFRRHGVATP